MAEGSILKYSDLIQDDGIFEVYGDKLTKMEKITIEVAKTMKGGIKLVDPQDTVKVQELYNEMKKLKAQYDALKSAKEKGNEVKKKAADLSNKELIALQREREAQRARNLEAKNVVKINDAQQGSIEQMRAKLALVTIAWIKLSEAERETTERGKRLTQSKLELNEALKKEESATGDNRRSVGGYEEAVKKAIIATREEKNALEELLKTLVSEQRGFAKSSTEYKVYQKEITNAQTKLTGLENSLNETKSQVISLSSSFNSAKNILGAFGIALGAVSLARSAFQTIKEFDEGAAGAAKTLNITKEEARELSVELLNIDTRTPVGQLQQLAAASGRLGISGKQNVIDFVTSADMAFVALGEDLGGTADEIATTLGKIAGVFGVEGKYGIGEAIGKVGSSINELANNSKAGAGNIVDFTKRMAGLSSQSGIAQSDISALGALFDEAGQSMEVSASALGKFLPELSKQQEKYAKTAGMTSEAFGELIRKSPIEALKAVAIGARSSKEGLTGLTETLATFGITSAQASGVIGVLSSKTERLTELQKISKDAFDENTSLLAEFNTVNETLGANVDKLSNSWNNYIIGLDSASGASSWLSSAIKFLSGNLSTIINLVGKLAIVLGLYKAAMLALDMKKKILDQIEYNKAVKESGKVSGDAAQGAGKFGQALKAIGFSVAITIIFELAKAFYDVASGAASARDAMARFDKQLEKSSKEAEKKVNDLKEVEKQTIATLNSQLKSVLKNVKSTAKEKADAQKLYNSQILIAKKTTQDELNSYISAAKVRKQSYKDQKKELQDLVKAKNDLQGKLKGITNEDVFTRKQIDDIDKKIKSVGAKLQIEGKKIIGVVTNATAGELIRQLDANIGGINTRLIEYNGALKDADDATKDFTDNVVDLDEANISSSKSIRENTTALKANNDELQRGQQFLVDQAKLKKEIEDIKKDAELSNLSSDIAKETDRVTKKTSNFGNVDLTNLNLMLEKESKLKRDKLKSDLDFESQQLIIGYENEYRLREEALTNERNELLKQSNLTASEIAKINASYIDRTNELDSEMNQMYSIVILEKKKLDEEYFSNKEALDIEDFDRQKQLKEQLLSSLKEYMDGIEAIEGIQQKEMISQSNDLIKKQEEIIAAASGRRKTIEISALKEMYEARYQLMKSEIDNEIDYMLTQVEEGSIEEERLNAERDARIAELRRGHNNDMLKLDKDLKKSQEDIWKQFASDLRGILSEIANKISEQFAKAVQAAETSLQKQGDLVTRQRERAQQGLTNTLAFEKKEMAKREKELLLAQKRQQKMEKIKALYSSYSANAGNPNVNNPVTKTLKDFAILEAISASFKDGGYTGDGDLGLGKNAGGHIRGVVEEGEFVIDRKTTSALGLRKSTMKGFRERIENNSFEFGLPKSGLDTNLLSTQRREFSKIVQSTILVTSKLENEIRELKEWHMKQPTQTVNVAKISNDILEFVETISLNGQVTKNTYGIKKRRF